MSRIIVTGFTPFEGRSVNASWIAASQLQEKLGEDLLLTREIPVVWGEPEGHLSVLLEQEPNPAAIIAMGEGKPGSFRLETLALNRRAAKPDNNAQLPEYPRFVGDGPDSLRITAPLGEIRQALLNRGVPVLLSVDAGSYLCEETLFLLEHRFKKQTSGNLALFVHLPPFGSYLLFKGRERQCREDLLLEFASDLYEVIASQLAARSL
jgi:pyroglutamyl-peptidase